MEIMLQLDQWAEINNDLLDGIVQHIDCYGDYLRFRSVCKNWHLMLPKLSRHTKLPLLLLPFDKESDTIRPLYHVRERRVIHNIELPETKNTAFRGSCYGWLITIGLDGAVQMLEPFTRVCIDLPPLSTFPDVVDYHCDRIGEEYIRHKSGTTYYVNHFSMQNAYVDKIIISSSPDDDDSDFMAIAIYGESYKLSYYRRGDTTWSDFPTQGSGFCDVIFHEGHIYAKSYDGYIYKYDIKTMANSISRTPKHVSYDIFCRSYLVEMGGDLLVVTRHFNYSEIRKGIIYRTTGFLVYKLVESKGDEEARWLEMQSLGDYVIVLGINSSVSVLPRSISSNNRNCIYYSDDDLEAQFASKGGHDNGVFDLENQTIHHFFPDSDRICSVPVWLL